MAKGVIVLNLLWAIAAVVAIAFQCRLPRPWEVRSHHCFNQVCFNYLQGGSSLTIERVACILDWYRSIRHIPRPFISCVDDFLDIQCQNGLEEEECNYRCFLCTSVVRLRLERS